VPVNAPAFSVVIPLYNKEPHIARAVRSALIQTFGDYELVVVDDGSTDGSGEVVKAFNDPRIRLVHREHINSWGGHAARNLGTTESRADLIAFLDADDEWLPDYLQTIEALVGRFPNAGAWSTSYYRVSRSGIEEEWRPSVTILEGDSTAGLVDIFARAFGRPFFTSSVVVRKAALVSVGGFPAGVANGGDVDTWYRLAFRFPIACCLKPKVRYHRDVINPIDDRRCVWVGVRPYFDSLRRFIDESGGQDRVPKEVVDSVMKRHYRCFRSNLLAGNRPAALRVACDFVSTRGFAGQGLAMLLASLPPYWLSRLLLRVRRFVKYRTWALPKIGEIRSIYPRNEDGNR